MTPDEIRDIGDRLCELDPGTYRRSATSRSNHGWQTRFCEESGVARSTMRDWIAGKPIPPYGETLLRWAVRLAEFQSREDAANNGERE